MRVALVAVVVQVASFKQSACELRIRFSPYFSLTNTGFKLGYATDRES